MSRVVSQHQSKQKKNTHPFQRPNHDVKERHLLRKNGRLPYVSDALAALERLSVGESGVSMRNNRKTNILRLLRFKFLAFGDDDDVPKLSEERLGASRVNQLFSF
jgi:hypothetical protein